MSSVLRRFRSGISWSSTQSTKTPADEIGGDCETLTPRPQTAPLFVPKHAELSDHPLLEFQTSADATCYLQIPLRLLGTDSDTVIHMLQSARVQISIRLSRCFTRSKSEAWTSRDENPGIRDLVRTSARLHPIRNRLMDGHKQRIGQGWHRACSLDPIVTVLVTKSL